METWNIGDVVLATPFLAELRSLFPNASITLLARPHASAILAGTDLVDRVVEVELPWTVGVPTWKVGSYEWGELRRVVRLLRNARFDIAFESRMDPRAKVVLAVAGARRRVAYAYGGGNWLLTDPVRMSDRERHKREDWMGLLEPFGGPRGVPAPRLRVKRHETEWAQQWLRGRGIPEGSAVIAIHPGASSASKRWPLDRFAAVATALTSRADTCVVVVCDPEGYGSSLANIDGVVGIQPDLRQLMAVLSECSLLVGNDSGPIHLAAGLGVATVGVYHAHAVREFAPVIGVHHCLAPSAGPQERFPPPASALLAVSVADVIDSVALSLARRS